MGETVRRLLETRASEGAPGCLSERSTGQLALAEYAETPPDEVGETAVFD